jgi:hypothetical protein
LNPTVITWTPSPIPSPTPTLSPAEQLLVWADEEGVRLVSETTLYQLYQSGDSGIPEVLKEITLDADTQVLLLSDEEKQHPTESDLILREVEVVDGLERGRQGWLSQDALEGAVPLTPRVTPKGTGGVNIRLGDSTVFGVVGTLQAGEYATLLGVSSRGSGWYKIQFHDSTLGWVSPQVVNVMGDIRGLPVLSPPPLPKPTVTPTEGVAITPLVTETTPPAPAETVDPGGGAGGGGNGG